MASSLQVEPLRSIDSHASHGVLLGVIPGCGSPPMLNKKQVSFMQASGFVLGVGDGPGEMLQYVCIAYCAQTL
jgi:hypothetical protein